MAIPDKPSKTGVIAGAVIGSVLGLAILAGLIGYHFWNKAHGYEQAPGDDTEFAGGAGAATQPGGHGGPNYANVSTMNLISVKILT